MGLLTALAGIASVVLANPQLNPNKGLTLGKGAWHEAG
jgi:hypothetical protein